MRVLVVATNIRVPDSHGGSTHVGELVSCLGRHAEVMLVARRGSTGPGVLGVGLPSRTPPLGLAHAFSALHLARCLGAVRRFAPDVIYERGSSWGLGAMLGAVLGVPVLTMVLDEHVSPLSLARAGRLIATRLDLIPAWARSRGERVSWGANTERFHPGVSAGDWRSRWGIPASATVVMYTGSFQAWHGLSTLVEAATRLRARPIRFVLVGDGRVREEIRAQAEAAGVSGSFVFTGRVAYESVPSMLAASDVCVAPFDPSHHALSRSSGFVLDPLKVFEYLAMGKPTVTIRAGNLEGLFRDPEHLWMVAPRDAGALAEAIEEILADPAEAAARAERGRAVVLARHTWQAHASHLMRLFEEMIAERARTGRG